MNLTLSIKTSSMLSRLTCCGMRAAPDEIVIMLPLSFFYFFWSSISAGVCCSRFEALAGLFFRLDFGTIRVGSVIELTTLGFPAPRVPVVGDASE